METSADLSRWLGGNVARLDALRMRQLQSPELYQLVDSMGELSAQSMGISKVVTSSEKLMQSNHVIYVMWERDEDSHVSRLLGFIKVGTKTLFFYDQEMKTYHGPTLCVLDFYVHHSRQRGGVGKHLFDFMLQSEKIKTSDLAFDSPSVLLISFMHKHYNLDSPIWQNTNFVVYPQFFEDVKDKNKGKCDTAADGWEKEVPRSLGNGATPTRWLQSVGKDSESKLSELNDCANRMRLSSIHMTTTAGSGHPTSACSSAEILSALFFHTMKYDVKNGRCPHSDRFVMSKGHACPILYAAYHELGVISKDEMLSLRKIDSDIEGHPTPRLPFIDVATGSLGQGLSCAAGMAYTGKYWDKASYNVFCLIGDGESAEGSIWEALSFSSHYKLDNLIAVFDVNRLGQSQPTMLQHDVETYRKRLDAFGWHAHVVDGHDITSLCKLMSSARANADGKPTAIVAKTFKGKGIPNVENLDNWHGKPVGDKGVKEIEAMIKNKGPIKLCVTPPTKDAPDIDLKVGHISMSQPPNYKVGEKVATRMAYGTALAKLGENNPRVVGLDGDTKNSTFSDKLLKCRPEQFIECFIAEQNMVGVGIGCGTRSRAIPFVSTFAAFFTRAADQLRMGAVSMTNLKCAGSHVGVSIGEDGPSQMGLEDLGLFRSLCGSTVFYPTDAVAAENAVQLAANTKGICYIRTSRPALPTIYANDEKFEVGKGKILRQSANDKILIISCGVTLYEAQTAADAMKKDGIDVCILDPFTVKPLDEKLILSSAEKCKNVLVVEDHYPEGGLGEAVSHVLASSQFSGKFAHLCVRELPRSGAPNKLLEMFGISANCVEKKAREMVK